MVSVTVAVSVRVVEEGLTAQLRFAEVGTQLNETTPLKLFSDARLRLIVLEPPLCRVICVSDGVSVKSPPPAICVAVMFTTLLVDDE
jgi:hypothetical protein